MLNVSSNLSSPRRWLLTLLAISIFAAVACSSDSEATATAEPTTPAATQSTATTVPPTAVPDTPTPNPPTAVPTTSTPTPLSESATKIGVRSVDEHGDVLVDGNGLTLYIFDRDTEGVSNCAGGCLTAWPPLLTSGEPEVDGDVTADIGTIELADGTLQVTVNDFPAYYWQGDATAGDTLGHGVNAVWWVFNADGTPQRPAKIALAEDPDLGNILVDGDGLTLYIFDRDTEGVSNCAGGCLAAWPPLLTEYPPVAVGDVTADIGTIELADGTLQVTVNDFPAYYWQGDAATGDTLGHGVNAVWWVFNADGTPQRPAKVALAEHSQLGNILVDENGFTLYLFDNDEPGVSNCSGGCLSAWPALLTEYPPVAVGDVTATIGTITRDDGTTQVTVNDLPVYYWQNDAEPGDALGHAVSSVWWVMDAAGTAIRN